MMVQSMLGQPRHVAMAFLVHGFSGMKTNSCLFGLVSLLFAISCSALTVTSPVGTSVVAAGDDYATGAIGDAWDMNNAQDIDTDESSNLAAQTFSAGLFSATAST